MRNQYPAMLTIAEKKRVWKAKERGDEAVRQVGNSFGWSLGDTWYSAGADYSHIEKVSEEPAGGTSDVILAVFKDRGQFGAMLTFKDSHLETPLWLDCDSIEEAVAMQMDDFEEVYSLVCGKPYNKAVEQGKLEKEIADLEEQLGFLKMRLEELS